MDTDKLGKLVAIDMMTKEELYRIFLLCHLEGHIPIPQDRLRVFSAINLGRNKNPTDEQEAIYFDVREVVLTLISLHKDKFDNVPWEEEYTMKDVRRMESMSRREMMELTNLYTGVGIKRALKRYDELSKGV